MKKFILGWLLSSSFFLEAIPPGALGGISEHSLYQSWEHVKVSVDSFPFHREHAPLLVAAKYQLNKNDTSNVAIVGFTVKDVSGISCSEILFLLHSGLSKDEGGVIKVLNYKMFPIPAVFREDPLLPASNTRTHNLLRYLNKLSGCQEHIMSLEIPKLLESVEAKVSSEKDLDKVGELPDKSQRKLLGSLLHCEQVAFLRMLTDDRMFESFINKIRESNISKINYISLDIITYNDMCRNCFSTCYNFRDDFFSIVKRLCGEKGILFSDSLKSLQLVVSSVMAFTNIDNSTTRKIVSQNPFGSSLLAMPRDVSTLDYSTSVIQFMNPWVFEPILSQEVANIQASISAIKVDSILSKRDDFFRIIDFIKSFPKQELEKRAQELNIDVNIVKSVWESLKQLIESKIAEFRSMVQQIYTAANSLFSSDALNEDEPVI